MELRRVIGERYLIKNLHLDRIGRGGAGNVYRATDTHSGRPVAVKHLKPELIAGDGKLVERFAREGEALRRLNHPNIVTMLDTVTEDDQHYLIMEYVPGGSLADLLQEKGPLPVTQVLQISLELADALTRAHHLNIIHRDIKPGNVLVAQDGTPRLTDFGMAHMGDLAPITQTGTLTGTYAYLSPEACEGQALDLRADIWSFGVLLYEMLTGRAPFLEGNLSATLLAILSKPVPDVTQFRAETPESLANLIYHMLKKERERRMGSIRLVGAKLEAIMAGMAGEATAAPRFDSITSEPVQPIIGPRHNLPRQPTPFVGREPEIQELVDTLKDPDCRLLTMVGPGGIGKTRLSLEAAARRVDDYQHGVRFVPLAAVSNPEYLITAIADTLGIVFFDDADPAEQLGNYLRGKQMLLVLDNFEHLVEGAEYVSELLALAPRLQILITSREALNLWEEWTRPVRGMRYPQDRQEKDILPYSAVRLFIARAKRVLGRFDLQAELPHIIRICQLVDGMPLGIELSATWLRVLSPAQIAQEIERSYDFLETNMRNIAERHRSIRAVFNYSWQLLDETEKKLFRRLAVFQGGFRRGAATAVTGASLLTLTELVNKSLLYEGETHYTDTPVAEGRYSIHELLKQFAEEMLAQDEIEKASVQKRHAGHYTRLLRLQESRLHGREQKEALEKINQDLDNVRVAWRWTLSHLGSDEQALQFLINGAESLYIFYETRGIGDEGTEMFIKAIDALRGFSYVDRDPARQLLHRLALGKVVSYQGVLHYRMNRRPMAESLLREGVQLLRELADDPAVDSALRLEAKKDFTLALVYLGAMISRANTASEAREMLREAVEVAIEIDDRWHLARAKNALAIHTIGYQEQVALYKEALAIAQEIGDQIMTTRIVQNLSGMTNDPYESLAYADQIFAIYENIGNPTGLVMGHYQTGMAASRLGQYERGRRNFERGIEICQEFGLREGLLGVVWGLAQVSWALGDLDAAQRNYETMVTMSQEEGDAETMIKMLYQYGAFLLERGETAKAKRQYKASRCLLEEVPTAAQRAESLDALGNFALDLGKYDVARTYFQTAAPLFEEVQDVGGLAWSLANLGTIAFETGDYVTARERYVESLTLHRTQGMPWNIGRVLNMLGRVSLAQGDERTAAGCFLEALEILRDVWAGGIELEIVVDWVSLLIRSGQKERALETLYVVCASPSYAPSLVSKRTREMAPRLLEELEAYLSPAQVTEASARAQGRSQEDVIAGLLREIAVPTT